jgi:hypothetical protein
VTTVEELLRVVGEPWEDDGGEVPAPRVPLPGLRAAG